MMTIRCDDEGRQAIDRDAHDDDDNWHVVRHACRCLGLSSLPCLLFFRPRRMGIGLGKNRRRLNMQTPTPRDGASAGTKRSGAWIVFTSVVFSEILRAPLTPVGALAVAGLLLDARSEDCLLRYGEGRASSGVLTCKKSA